MSNATHIPSLKADPKSNDLRQYNAIINYVQEQKYGVRATMMGDYENLISALSSLLWEIDPHHHKLQVRGCSFINIVQDRFLQFNKPQCHGHKPKQLSAQNLILKVDKLRLFLDRGYMNQKHMTKFKNIVSSICDSVQKYIDYLNDQLMRVTENHNETAVDEPSIEEFTIKKLKYHIYEDSLWEDRFLNLKDLLRESDSYTPIEINCHLKSKDRNNFNYGIKTITTKGFLYLVPNSCIYYFKLPSQGPYNAIHFLWKQPENENDTPEQLKLIYRYFTQKL